MAWKTLSKLPVLKEILADQFSPFIMLFPAVLVGLGLDAFLVRFRDSELAGRWSAARKLTVAAASPLLVIVVALAPVWATFDVPLTVQQVQVPTYMAQVAPELPAGTVLLTVPFAVSGSARPMLWQAVEDMHFHLAGAALKTPNARGGPVGNGAPGSARRILTDLTLNPADLPAGTPAQVASVRQALVDWQVDEVVVTGTSADPVYASGFFTSVLGRCPGLREGGLGVEAPPRVAVDPAGDRALAPGVRRRGEGAGLAERSTGDVTVRPLLRGKDLIGPDPFGI